MSELAVELDFLIEEYAGSRGSYPPKKRQKRKTIYVATIEKASGLINSLIDSNRMDSIGLCVVDEVLCVTHSDTHHLSMCPLTMNKIPSELVVVWNQ